MKTSIHELFRALAPAAVFGIMLTLILSVSSGVADSGNIKIAPTEAAPPHPFTLIDTPLARLVDGSVAVFKLNSAETILPLNTHKPYKTAQGAIPEGMGGGTYEVYVRMPDGTEFFVGTFKVDAPAITPVQPSISPTSGTNGDAIVIRDPEGRMAGATLIVFFPQGGSPEAGTQVLGAEISADGTEARGNVPGGIIPGSYFVTVHITSVMDLPLFNALSFVVT